MRLLGALRVARVNGTRAGAGEQASGEQAMDGEAACESAPSSSLAALVEKTIVSSIMAQADSRRNNADDEQEQYLSWFLTAAHIDPPFVSSIATLRCKSHLQPLMPSNADDEQERHVSWFLTAAHIDPPFVPSIATLHRKPHLQPLMPSNADDEQERHLSWFSAAHIDPSLLARASTSACFPFRVFPSNFPHLITGFFSP
ncbi:hypothetical protein RRG08_043279 [Elysia crispata]|uniref:Uncharacterized protein n=1 Tax=Elysia crispata TaxID=231223 RepID=A0AAE0XXS0_9GAST|nr:hypothetical protein RRG08_043279 [Elysia crispata]